MSPGKSVLGGQNSQCKGPEAQAGLAYSKNSEEANVAGVGEQGGVGQGARKSHIAWGLVGHCKDFGFYFG